jgi:hypothetical protein
MKTLIFFFVIFFPAIALSQNKVNQALHDKCIVVMDEQTAALHAGDFEAVKRITLWKINNCMKFFGSDDLFDEQGFLALAERELGNLKEALQIARECIYKRYGIPSCHLEEALSLKALGLKNKADISGERFIRICERYIDQLQAKLENPNLGNLEVRLINSKLYLHRAMLNSFTRDWKKD